MVWSEEGELRREAWLIQKEWGVLIVGVRLIAAITTIKNLIFCILLENMIIGEE